MATKHSFIIVRTGNRHTERAVSVFEQYPSGRTRLFWINPADAVHRVTRRHHGRYGCIIEFAHGLAAAGHEVIICDRRDGAAILVKKIYCHRAYPYQAFNIYFVFGLLWGLGKWPVAS